jgi:hypothetical protein
MSRHVLDIFEARARAHREKEAELQSVVQILEAMVAQKREQQPTEKRPLGERLARRPIGNLLLARGYIHEAELQLALKRQALTPGKRLGEVLIDMELVTDRDIAEVLSEQMRLPLMPLARVDCNPEVVAMISRHDARRLCATPVYRTLEGGVAVAIADPTDEEAVDTMLQLLRMPVEFYVAAHSDIIAVIDARDDAVVNRST